MVFGNMGEDSGTGVAFTRNPHTGEHVLYGEYLLNAQGEDVVAGIRTRRRSRRIGAAQRRGLQAVPRLRPELEKHYQDMQDLEFTVERGKLYMLQTRYGKRAGRRRRQDRRRHGRGRPHRQGRGDQAHRAAPARATLCTAASTQPPRSSDRPRP